MEPVTAFVLAGGRSSRMGSDKALLSFGNDTLLARAISTAGQVATTVAIVGPRERYAAFGDVVEDIYPGCGPLSGIHAALCASKTDLNLMLSVDMPLLTAQFLLWLLKQASAANEVIAVPDALGGWQPLCAAYRRSVRVPAEEALKAGDLKIAHLFRRAATRYIPEQEIVAAGFAPAIFSNVNTVEEYERLLRDQSLTAGAAKGQE